MKPACEIDEYASIRFTFRCTSAARLPIASDATAMTGERPASRGAPPAGTPSCSTRNASTNAATFVAADMNAVTVVGAPS